jgi:hypothetical protein
MKFLLVLLLSSIMSTASFAVEKKEVCRDVLDRKGAVVKNKDGSAKQECKIIKIHKKFEGKKVPEKK